MVIILQYISESNQHVQNAICQLQLNKVGGETSSFMKLSAIEFSEYIPHARTLTDAMLLDLSNVHIVCLFQDK